ncbi:hypothetical protein O7621_01325 [Solwaraspora sp. WMMD937]|uniref:hypothetical protein n=1 Tax=Solwaraspora sp. WMMD937 TaxID=3016090 RepID=UPI00249A97F6|nr:hypothetical protein [Solwaraspora sp. WMMD937]WFE22050.1 hypothetical protein O7621_01325 [Solwaraspora sp. WMMD937]
MTVTARPVESTGAPSHPPGRHRRHRPWHLAGLAGALAAAVLLVVLPQAGPTTSADEPGRLRTVAEVWPAAEITEVPANLADGPAYSPVLFLDGGTSVGTAPSPDGTALRLVVRAADGSVRELRRLPLGATPQFGGFTANGDTLAWSESVADEDGRGRTEMWAAGWVDDAEPRRLTTDTGDVVFFNSQYDMVINEGSLYWVAVAPGTEPATELRSVPLAGGEVTVRTDPGAWALSRWPTMVSAGSGETGPIRIRDVVERRITDVPAGPTELVTCGPTWCRVLVLAADGPGRIDLMRPDGTDRRRIGDGSVTASTIDVAVLDRFEVLSLSSAPTSLTNSQQLIIYDLQLDEAIVVSDDVGMVLCRGGVLWWSVGDDSAASWQVLDLRSLTD